MSNFFIAKLFFLPLLFISYFALTNCTAAHKEFIQAEDIINQIKSKKNVFYSNKLIKGKLDFTVLDAYVISSNASKIDIEVAVTFDNCKFEEDVIAYAKSDKGKVTFVEFSKCLSFNDCVFEKQIQFREIIVKGLFNLTKCQVQGEVGMEGSQLHSSYSFFTETKFKAETRFQRLRVLGHTDFLKTEFWEKASFQLADFDGNVMFADAVFNKNLDFSLALFSKKLILNNSLFYGYVDFSNASFKGRTEFINTQCKQDVTFYQIQIWDVIKLNTSTFKGNLSFEKAQFYFHKPELKEVIFEKESGVNIKDAWIFQKTPLELSK